MLFRLGERWQAAQTGRRVLGDFLGGRQKQFRNGRDRAEKAPRTRNAAVETCYIGRQQSRHGQEQRGVGPRYVGPENNRDKKIL